MNQKKTREFIEDLLLRAGIAPTFKGFAALAEAIMIAAERPETLNAITRKPYPAVAEKVGSTWKRVERTIRHAIENSFNSGGFLTVAELFKLPPDFDSGKYTNSEFIGVAALLVRRECCE